MAQSKITWQRLRQIMNRQREDRWSPDYIAGIFSDPREAPGLSTAAILRPGGFKSEVQHPVFSE